MQKRSVGWALLILLVVFSFVIGVYAQDAGEEVSLTETGSDDGRDVAEDDSSVDDDSFDGGEDEETEVSDEEEVDALIEEAEEFDEEFDVNPGFTPDSRFYFLDKFFGDSREEAVAEMRDLTVRCKEGDQDACDALDISFDKYKEQAEKYEKEVSPEDKEEAEETSRAIRGVMVREIAKNVDPIKKDEFIREIVKKENDIELAGEIAAQINELCNKLIDLGEIKEAKKVCNLDEDKDAPEWLKKKRGEWNEEISSEAQKFLDILQVCMDVSDDDILGNTESCKCNEMPGQNADLCSKIVKLEDACGAGEEDACGEGDKYIEEFMSILPDDLRGVMEREFGEFEEEEFEDRRPPQCKDIEDFKKCMLKMAEEHLDEAPPQCRDALRDGIRSGEIKGPRDGRRVCEEIMMEEFGDSECIDEDLSPNECAEFMSQGNFGPPRRGPGPGVDFSVCENIKDAESRANCYKDNVEKAGFAEDYYNERGQNRERFGEEFDEFGFEKEFRGKNLDKYADFGGRGDYERRGKFRTEEEARADFDKRRKEHETKIRDFAQSCQGAWDCSYGDITPEKPCRCYEEDDFREDFDRQRQSQSENFRERGPPECAGLSPEECGRIMQERSGPPPEFGQRDGGEFVPPEFSPPPEGSQPPEGSSGSTGESGSSGEGGSGGEGSSGGGTTGEGGGGTTTGGVIWGRITGNAFLDYYFR